jgi:hypothetical protein
MKKKVFIKLAVIVLIVVVAAICVDNMRICYREAKIVAENPAQADARVALKSLLSKPLLARHVIKRLLASESVDFSLEFRRRLYRELHRKYLDSYKDIILSDIREKLVTNRDLFSDGTLIASFPAAEDEEYQNSLAKWLSTADEHETATFYWTIEESPILKVTSADLKLQAQIKLEELLKMYSEDPEEISDYTMLNVGFFLEKMAKPELQFKDSIILCNYIEKINNCAKSIHKNTLEIINSIDVLIYMYSQCSDSLLRAEISSQLVEKNKIVALDHYKTIERSLTSVDRKTYLCNLAISGLDLKNFSLDDSFRGAVPRLVMYHIHDVAELPSFREYSSITGKDYFEIGKRFPLGVSMSEVQIKRLKRFCEEYKWHPGADDAYYRLASCAVQDRDWESSYDFIFQGLSRPDTDAHPYLKILMVYTLAVSGELSMQSDVELVLFDTLDNKNPVNHLVECNKMAFVLPKIVVKKDVVLATKILKYLQKNHRVGQEEWGMTLLAWESINTRTDEGWLHFYSELVSMSDNPTKLFNFIREDLKNNFYSCKLVDSWNGRTLVGNDTVDLTRKILVENSLIYQLFLNRSSYNSTELRKFYPILMHWLSYLCQEEFSNRMAEDVSVTVHEREVARWLVEAVKKQEWENCAEEDLDFLITLINS